QRRAVWSLAAVLDFQGLVGYYQHLKDLPIGAVWIHMFGIGLVTWAMTIVLDILNSKYETVPTQHELARIEETEALTLASYKAAEIQRTAIRTFRMAVL